ncbi:MAG: transposase [Candidatus Diapherotrites archaeon]
MKAYKYRIYPSKAQEREMNKHLWLSKNLWNELLAHNKRMYRDYGYFATKNSMQRMVKEYGLFSQTQQAISDRLQKAIMRYLSLKKQGKECGFPRFKSIGGMKSLAYPQHGFRLNKKLKVSPFGEIKIKRHREIEGKIKTLSLKKYASGKWFAVFCAEQEKRQPAPNNGGQIGIDLGLITFAACSDGKKIVNPKHIKLHEGKLASMQRRFVRKIKRSRNRIKAKVKIARLHERVANSRKDFLHKISTNLVNDCSLIALEKLQSQKMAEQTYGKFINDAGWGMFADMLRYKAESAGCEVVFVNPKNTTKMCSRCGSLHDLPLSQRVYSCECGLEMDRDVNAAINMLALAMQDTPGMSGINACGNGTIVPSMKQEARGFSHG